MVLEAGGRIGPYRIVERLGQGGMGEVYRARDERLGRDVAVKVLPEVFLSDPERLTRFEREARVLASLNHPNIAAIYGLEETAGTPALVIEFVAGETLARRIDRGPMPLDEALRIAQQIGEALEAAHERGIIHRDLKPANIMLTADGIVKLLDFGLAKALEGEVPGNAAPNEITRTCAEMSAGIILGTASYMSPEQARGQSADKRTDIWAFGCVLYEILTGRPAFEGESLTDILTPEMFTALGQGELSHRWPEILPGGKAVIYTIWNDTGFDNARVVAQPLEKGAARINLIQGGGYARFAASDSDSGHLIYARSEGLMAVPFDPQRLKVTGTAVPILEDVVSNLSGGAHYSVSGNGTLAYLRGGVADNNVALWVDRSGSTQVLKQIRGMSLLFSLSPDGHRVARTAIEGSARDIWIDDLDRGVPSRLTFDGFNNIPVWTPDGKRVTFASGVPVANLFWKAADGSSPEERLTTSGNSQFPGEWSPDGKTLAYIEVDPANAYDIWTLSLEGDRKPRPLVATQFQEGSPTFSPDGRWFAYDANDSGRFEVFVQPFPGGGQRWQISTEGGYWPRWSRDGREIFYRMDQEMLAVSVTLDPVFKYEKPRVLLQGRFEGRFDVSPDSRRFLMLQRMNQDSMATQVHVVLNWYEELRRRVPSSNR